MHTATKLFFLVLITASQIVAKSGRCAQCHCDSNSQVLLMNCTNTKDVNNRQLEVLPDFPEVDTYNKFEFTSVVAEFEGNGITKVESITFDSLAALSLAHNRIIMTDNGAFEKLTSLRRLDLSDNKALPLTAETFRGLDKLEVLSLYKTSLKSLGTFLYHLKSLTSLDLGYNFLMSLEEDAFDKQNNLTTLLLNQNGLSSIHPNLFVKMTALQVLDLSGNAIESLESKVFDRLKALLRLDLSSNSLSTFSRDFFVSLTRLSSLNLSDNRIGTLGESLGVGSSLVTLDVGHNKLFKAEFMMQELAGLRNVYLEDNFLTDLAFLAKHDKIEVLNASTNQISTFPASKFPRLHTLDLSNNTYTSLPLLTAENLPKLGHLRLDYNPIVNLRFPSSSLVFTNLSHVSISNMPDLRAIRADSFSALHTRSKRDTLSARKTRDVDDDTLGHVASNQRPSDVKITEYDDYEYEDEEETESETANGDVPKETVVVKEGEAANGDVPKESVVVKEGETANGDVPKESVVVKEGETSNGDVPKETVVVKEGETANGDVVKKMVAVKKFGTMVGVNAESIVDDGTEQVKDGNQGDPGKQFEEENPMVKEVIVNRPEMPKIGNLRSEPVIDKRDEIESVAQSSSPNPSKPVAACSTGQLILSISNNKNLQTIEEGAFNGVDMCELDLSYNSLSSVPEKMLDWKATPFINLQGNPWDCSCKLQWLLDIIVPKLYNTKPQLLYELRCTSPQAYRDKRFVHFYNWTKPAFCNVVMTESVRSRVGGEDEEQGITLKMGGSSGMLIVVGVACAVVLILVGVGVYLQRRLTLKRRQRNRRV